MDKAMTPIDAAVAAVLAGHLTATEAAKRYDVVPGTVRSRVSRERSKLVSGVAAAPTQGEANDGAQEGIDACNAAPTHATRTINPSPGGQSWQSMAAELAGDARLSAPQITAAAMMVAGHQYSEIAAETGLSKRTLSRLKHDAVFGAVCSDLAAACHMRARHSLARGAEESVAALRSATALLQRLVQRAHHVMDGYEDPAEDVSIEEVKGAISQALDAARFLPSNAKPLMDAGGFPKTARVEHVGIEADDLESKSDEEIIAEIADLESNIVDLAAARESAG